MIHRIYQWILRTFGLCLEHHFYNTGMHSEETMFTAAADQYKCAYCGWIHWEHTAVRRDCNNCGNYACASKETDPKVYHTSPPCTGWVEDV